jgi:hypothetical protein
MDGAGRGVYNGKGFAGWRVFTLRVTDLWASLGWSRSDPLVGSVRPRIFLLRSRRFVFSFYYFLGPSRIMSTLPGPSTMAARRRRTSGVSLTLRVLAFASPPPTPYVIFFS